MKIIRQGIKPEDRMLEGTCNNCRTQIEFTQGEATAIPDRNETIYQYICPTCECMITGKYKSSTWQPCTD